MTLNLLRRAAVLVLPALCLLVLACSSSTAGDPLVPTPSAGPAVAGSTSSPAGSPTPTLAPGQFEILALDALSASAASLARDLGPRIGIAVVVPSQRRIYQYNAEPQFPIASVIKVPIMLTVMHQAIEDGRVISDQETDLIDAMITESDNDAATELWNHVGGERGVMDYLETVDISGVTLVNENWGESEMSAVSAARLMNKLVQGETLDEPHREYALELLAHVDPVQDWGAVVAGNFDGIAGVKNGWYPEYEGWVLGSLGYVIPEGDSPAFTIAIFTDEWDYFGQAVNKIEILGGIINTALSEQ